VDPYIGAAPDYDLFGPASQEINYQLLNQSSGRCTDHLSCAYENCVWPLGKATFPYFPPDTSPHVLPEGFDSSTLSDSSDEFPMNLPNMVLHLKTAFDIVQAVNFCKLYKIGITVKVAEHSYFGSSTARGTLLIKMSRYVLSHVRY
jgi:hypothetical protein